MQTKRLTFIALFTVLTYIAGFITIPLGAVPITLQTVMVILTAVLLKPTDAAIAMTLHLFLKLMLGGGQIILAPSFGFLIGFIVAASVASLYLHKQAITSFTLAIAVLLAALLPYLIGLPYMVFILNIKGGAGFSLMELLQMGFFIFIPGDSLKALLSYVIAKRLLPVTNRLLAAKTL